MKKVPLLFLIMLIVSTPFLLMVAQSTSTTEGTSQPKSYAFSKTQPENGGVNMMFFTETPSSEDALYYVCRRGSNTVAYFGKSAIKYISENTIFTLKFPGSNLVIPQGQQPTKSITNYLYGDDPLTWKTDVPNYEILQYPEIYPGIDLVYKIQNGNLKYEFVVHPHADPTVIRIEYVNADNIDIIDNSIIVTQKGHQITDTELYVFQKAGAVPIECMFTQIEDKTVAFQLSAYDNSKQLVIDPVLLVYSSFLGGSDFEAASEIKVENGYIYVAGTTQSANFPTANALNSTYGGNFDGYVTKLSPDGQSLVYSTFIGGANYDYIQGIAVEQGEVYITGYSNSVDFPTVNGYNSTFSGDYDCFVAKLSLDGQSLIYSTFIGDTDLDVANDIIVQNGYAYITGRTKSAGFPTINGFNTTYGGAWDCFVTKLSRDGGSLLYSTFVGGSDDDYGQAIAILEGEVYVVGITKSPEFPTINASDSTHNGAWDCFVLKLSGDGQTLMFSTFIGGNNDDLGVDIATAEGEVLITGHTNSSDFPTVNAYSSNYRGGEYDCFVTKLTDDGQAMIYSTFIGGSDIDEAMGLAIANGEAYITGITGSADFPTVNAYDSTFSGHSNCFVTKIASDGKTLEYSTFLGDSDQVRGESIFVENGFTYIFGTTMEIGFPLVNPYDSTTDKGTDSFVAIISEEEDSDFDGLTNWDEYIIYGTNPNCIDTDNDNLNDAFEIQIGTSPLANDTDGDTFLDWYEIQYGSNPLDPTDYPGATATNTTTSVTDSQNLNLLWLLVGIAIITSVGAVMVSIISWRKSNR
ncbi:MAG: hypothetical protein K9W43_10385 [Candidatus Thorarchaeota archaeon]|nr:hypothetical protein [Candidatus Thorarchaeota archaeon]